MPPALHADVSDAPPPAGSAPRPPRDASAGLVVASAALGMVVLGSVLLHYGLDLVDEGTLLAQFDRVRAGQWPYRDFRTGYGPGAFVLHGALFRLFAPHLDVVRWGLVVTHAIALGAAALLAARALGGCGAGVVVLLTVSFFLPIAPGAFCVWNIPYPSWYAHMFGAVALLAGLAAPSAGGRALMAAGACWGLSCCFKQNTGLLGIAAMVVWRAIEHGGRGSDRGQLGLGVALATGIVGGLLLVLSDGVLGHAGALALAGPGVVLAWRVVHARPGRALVVDVGWLAAGFLAVVGPVGVGLGWWLGWGVVAKEMLHLGSGAAEVFRQPYPGLDEFATVVGMATGARGMRQAVDAAWFLIFPAAHLIAAWSLRPGAQSAAWRLLVPTAVLYYVQVYPRADFWHLLPLAAVSLIVTVGVATRAVAAVGGERRWPAHVLLGGLIVLATVRWVPNAAVVAAALSAVPRDTPRLERANVRWDLVEPPALRAVPDVVEALAGAPQVVGFPALAIFNFLTGVPSPLRDDYFFPGVPSPGEDFRIASALADIAAARVVVLREPLGFFPAALTAHAAVDDAIRRTFPIVTRVGPYEVREAAP